MSDTVVQPLRLKVASAAKMCDVTPGQIRHLIKAGILTAIWPDGNGGGKKPYLIPAEVRAYATHGLAGVVRYREQQARKSRKESSK